MSVLALDPTPLDVPPLAVVGAGLPVPLVTGGEVPYANLDHAASAPCLVAVRDAVDALLPWYASVHRGAGFASQVSTRAYERCRDAVRRFVAARPADAVVFCRNTTDGVNLLAHALPRGTGVVVFETEHHANLLPWHRRAARVVRLPAPQTPDEALRAADEALAALPVGSRLLAVTGASNVTGELWPVRELARVAHRHGARILLDAAQLAPHRRLDMGALGVDWVVFSGHKLYAPFGAGVLVGRGDWLRAAPPYLVGGGATRRVTDTGVSWAGLPERQEAGTPNVLGAVALAAACEALAPAFDAVAAHEAALLRRLRAALGTVPGLRELTLWGPRHPRIGVVAFTVDGWPAGKLAAALSAEYGIGVRDGAFCAHPFVAELAGTGQSAVRASLGLGSTAKHVDRLGAALRRLVADGPSWSYAERDGRWGPDPDPRPWPELPLNLSGVEGCP
jgi:selenocysteine lyase/cysteine desulfurase